MILEQSVHWPSLPFLNTRESCYRQLLVQGSNETARFRRLGWGCGCRQSPSQLAHSNRCHEGKTFCPLLAKEGIHAFGRRNLAAGVLVSTGTTAIG